MTFGAGIELPNPELPWYNQPQTGVAWDRLGIPYGRFFVGSSPFMGGMKRSFSDGFDAFVDVGSPAPLGIGQMPQGASYHWIPFTERSINPYALLFAFIKTIDTLHELQSMTYVHCEAGASRSRYLMHAWLYRKLGNHEDASGISGNVITAEKFRFQTTTGYLPKETELFLDRIRDHPGASLEKLLLLEPRIAPEIDVRKRV